jgi:hypothetical protein
LILSHFAPVVFPRSLIIFSCTSLVSVEAEVVVAGLAGAARSLPISVAILSDWWNVMRGSFPKAKAAM